MKKYKVTLYFHSNATVEVNALNEQDALDKVREMDLTEQIDNGLLEEGNDVEEIEGNS